ncbi:unnamed protein product [Ectocarpus sp. 12 AP-2014]
MSDRERLEVSIFKDLNYTKTFISSIMRTDIQNGLGKRMIDLVFDLTESLKEVAYKGLVFEPGGAVSKTYVTVNFDCHVSMFGGAAYEMHKQHDSSPFARVLPGLHDVDTNLIIRCSSEDGPFEYPASRASVDYLRYGKNGQVFNRAASPLSYLLERIVGIIRDSLEPAVDVIAKRYRLDVKGETHWLILKHPDHHTPDDKTCMYQEVVGDLFRVKIVDEGAMMKVQVEVEAQDETTSESVTDHVFEMIIRVTDSPPPLIESDYDKIGGACVENKRLCFFNTIGSLLDRSVISMWHQMEVKNNAALENVAKQMRGKCAQDFLRILYIFLTEMRDSSGANDTWIDKEANVNMLPMRPSHVIKSRMIDQLGMYALPLNIFFFLTNFIEPCVQASTVSTMDVFEFTDGNHGFREVIEAFQEAFPENKKAAFMSPEDILQIYVEAFERDLLSRDDERLAEANERFVMSREDDGLRFASP